LVPTPVAHFAEINGDLLEADFTGLILPWKLDSFRLADDTPKI
jgi:hypothetical protein